jgi:hypothetical protein
MNSQRRRIHSAIGMNVERDHGAPDELAACLTSTTNLPVLGVFWSENSVGA